MASSCHRVLFLGSFLLTLLPVRTPTQALQAPALPVAFVPNRGQWPADVAFVARRGSLTLCAASGRLTCVADGAAVAIAFGDSTVRPRGEALLPGEYSFALGVDPARWVRGVRASDSIVYCGAFPGVDLRVRAGDGPLEYDLLLADAAAVHGVELRVVGASGLGIDTDGRLRIATAAGAIVQTVPRAWTTGPDGGERPVDCRFRLLGSDAYGFAVDAAGDDPLVIDPGLEWSTYLGAAGDDQPRAVAVDGDGNVIVAGNTSGGGFPTTSGVVQPVPGGWIDAFVAKFDPSGRRLLHATFLGGASADIAHGVAVGDDGAITVVGSTLSAEFPVSANAFDRTYSGGGVDGDVFVARFDATLGSLAWSTYLGGSGDERAMALALAPGGEVVIAGSTGSADFPTTSGALQTVMAGSKDGFVARLRAGGDALAWSTLLGGRDLDGFNAVALAADGSVWAAGGTESSDVRISAQAFDRTRGGQEGYVAHLAADASALLGATYLGGGGDDSVFALLLHDDGTVVAAGMTVSSDFPVTPGALSTFRNGSGDGFVARLDPELTSAQFATYLGGSSQEWVAALARGGDGQTIVAGSTNSPDFPTTATAFDRTLNGGVDAFIACLDATGATLTYGSFFGGASADFTAAMAADGPCAMVLVGTTASADLPTTAGAFDRSYAAGDDGFVARLELAVPCDEPAQFGWGTAGQAGVPRLATNSDFFADNDEFALWISRTAPRTVVLVALAAARATPPYELGYTLNVSPTAMLTFLTVSDVAGDATLPLSVPSLDPGLIGGRIACQAIAVDPTAPVGLSASRGLELPILQDPRPGSRAPVHCALDFANVADKRAQPTLDLLARWQADVVVQHDPPGRPYLHVVVSVARERAFLADAHATASVTAVREDRWLSLDEQGQAGFPSDPRYVQQWGLEEIGGPVYLGDQVPAVAVVDSGVFTQHNDLGASVAHGRDILDQDDDSTPHGMEGVAKHHGTAVAGVIGATIDNGVGIAGVAGRRPGEAVAPWIKVYRAGGTSTRQTGRRKDRPRDLDLFDVLEYVLANAAPGIVNLSMSHGHDLTTEHLGLLGRMASAQMLLTCSAGNRQTQKGRSVGRIARVPASVAVGALERDRSGALHLWKDSSRGEGLDLCAPGADIQVPRYANTSSGYDTVEGTSVAAPHVTGALAVVWSWTKPGQTARGDLVRALLFEHAVRKLDPEMARGIIDLSGELILGRQDGRAGATLLRFPTHAPQPIGLGGMGSVEIAADRAHIVFSDGFAIWLRQRPLDGRTPDPDVNLSARIGVPMLQYDSPVLTPDGRNVLFTASLGSLYAVIRADVNGNGYSILSPINEIRDHLHVSPDGRRVLFSDPATGIWSIDIASGARTLELANAYPELYRTISYGHARYSPDGLTIVAHAYDVRSQGHACGTGFVRVDTSLFLLRAGGGNQPRPIAATAGGTLCWKSSNDVWSGDAVCCATWSPNGRYLHHLYITNAPGQSEVRTLDIRTGTVARIAAAPDSILPPMWGRHRLVSSRW